MRLISIAGELHRFNGALSRDRPLRLQLAFSDGPALRLICASDGESMRFDTLPLDGPIDMGEAGCTEIRDMTARFDATLNGAVVEAVRRIRNGYGKTIGIALMLAEERTFCFWNNGDEFDWGDFSTMLRQGWTEEGHLTLGEPLRLEP